MTARPDRGPVLKICGFLTLWSAVLIFSGLSPHDAPFGTGAPSLARAAQDTDDPAAGDAGQDDSARKYQWLFKERKGDRVLRDPEAGTIMQHLDRDIKEARKLYLSGEIENSILKYRSVLDNLELLLDDIPAGNPLLREFEDRLQIFDEAATKILGPVHMEPREDAAGHIFHLMEKRRICVRSLTLKKAGQLRFFDAPNTLLAEETEILTQLLELKSEPSSPEVRQSIEGLTTKLGDVRRSLKKSSPRYALLRRGTSAPLAEIQKNLLGKDEMILDFNLLPDRMAVGVITAEKALYHQIPANRSEIDKGVFQLQEKLKEYSLSGRASFMGHAWKEPARRIYRSLLGKLPPLPSDKRTIFVIPDRALWYLPFSVMLDAEDRPLGRDRAISLIPSVDMLRFSRTGTASPLSGGQSGDLLLFEAIPWIPEQEIRQMSSREAGKKKGGRKLSEEERLERLIIANPVYPKPSEIVINLQKIFKKFEVWVGPTATYDRLLEYKDRKEEAVILAAPLAVSDFVRPDRQPTLIFASDGHGGRTFECRRFFELPLAAKIMALPVAWFEVQDVEAPLGEGPLLVATALLYSGAKACLINYSDPNWGADEPFLLNTLRKVAGQTDVAEAIAGFPREMPAGLDTSFSGKPPSWAGWILMGDPR